MTYPTLLTRVADDDVTDVELRTLAGFLGGYSGLTREAYALDPRQFAQWCHDRRVALFAVARHDIEAFARNLEDVGRARATISRRLCTAVEEGLLDRSPAVHVRRSRFDYESNATGLDRNEVGAMLVAAGLSGARDHALISLLASNGLRLSEATGADIEQLGLERGHRTLLIHRKGGKTVTVPLAPRTARAVDLAIGERCTAPSSATAPGNDPIVMALPELSIRAFGATSQQAVFRFPFATRAGPDGSPTGAGMLRLQRAEVTTNVVAVEILPSARKHGITDDDIRHATNNALVAITSPAQPEFTMLIGTYVNSRLLEVGVLAADDNDYIIHAMPARQKYLAMLNNQRGERR